MTKLVTDMVLACRDPMCGHTFGAQVSITRTISPSACPDPRIILPVAPPRAPIRRPAANDNFTDQVANG